MEKKILNIAGYDVTQVDEYEYYAENPEAELEFSYITEDPDEVIVFVFDYLKPKDDQTAFLANWNAETLEEAVKETMTFTKEGLKGYEWF